MVVASSFRPFSECTPEIAANQIRAKISWDKYADRVFYFNDPEPSLSGNNTTYIPCEGKPDIKSMAMLLSNQPTWGCIVNADIVLGPSIRRVMDTLSWCHADCVVSKRYTIPFDGDLTRGIQEKNDNGVDFFLARPSVWKKAAESVPKEFHLGRIVWDSWMVCFFVKSYFWSCYDITPAKAIFHPKHGGRCDQNFNVPDDPYLKKSLWPPHVIQ